MNSIESTKQSISHWHKRSSLKQIKNEIATLQEYMRDSKRCMRENRLSQSLNPSDVKKAIRCEVIHPTTLTPFNNWTFHTHPSNIPYPSDQDRKQTLKLNKEYLAIGVAPLMKVVVFHKDDNFQREIARF